MSEVRRPLNTPALGVPDVELAQARATVALKGLGNKKWLSVAAFTIAAVSPIFQLVATLSMTALITGRFRARWVGYAGNADAGSHNVFPGMSHGTGILIPDYNQSFGLLVGPSGEGSGSTIALIVDFPTAVGFTATLGSTTAFNCLIGADAAGEVFVRNFATQFEVEEY